MEGLRFFAMTSGGMWVYTGGLSPGPNQSTLATKRIYIYIFFFAQNYP